MSIKMDNILGKLKFKEIPKNLCWQTPEQFMEVLARYGYVNIDTDKDWEFVIISEKTPSADDVRKEWIRIGRNRHYEGRFLYINGKWTRIYDKIPGEITWMYGDSSRIPSGFKLATKENFPSDEFPNLKSSFITSTITPNVYTYFAVVYTGE